MLQKITPEDVNENSVLMDDLDLSSMEILTVVADLEETFGLRIPEKELRNFVTISDLADYLAAHAGGIRNGCRTALWFFKVSSTITAKTWSTAAIRSR